MFLPGPVIDDLLPARPLDAIRAGSAAGVRLIIGTNEGTMFVRPEGTVFLNYWKMIADMLEKNGHAEALPALVGFYHPAARETFRLFANGESGELFDTMAGQMHGNWVRFVKTGESNPDWPRFEGAKSPVRIYDRETRTEVLDRRHLMAVWGELRFYED